jgi:hypothetical protein
MLHPLTNAAPRRTHWLLWSLVVLVLLVVVMVIVLATPDAGTPNAPTAGGNATDRVQAIDNYLAALLPSLITLAVSALPILYFSALCHELGHATLARLSGYIVMACGAGLGRVIVARRVAGTVYYLGLQSPCQGITFVYPPGLVVTRRQLVAFALGGILAHCVLAVGALVVWFLWPDGIGGFIALTGASLNIALALINAAPFQLRVGGTTIFSDGAVLLYGLRAGAFPTHATQQIALAARLHNLWRETGDKLTEAIYLITAARAWLSLGCVARAEQLGKDWMDIPGPWPAHSAGLFAMARGLFAGLAGRTDDAQHAIAQAEAIFRERGQAGGLLTVDWIRADHLQRRGDRSGAVTAFEAQANHPLIVERPTFAIDLLAARLEARAASGETIADVGQLRSEFEKLRRRFARPEVELRAYTALGRVAMAQGDLALAAILRQSRRQAGAEGEAL